MDFDLTKWDKINMEIEQAKDIQTLSKLGNKLEAIRILGKQSKQSLEVQNKIAEYRLRVERKKGEWLEENIKVGNPQLLIASTIGLDSIGISRSESHRAQMIARLDKKQFEQYIEETKATNEEITLAGAVRLVKQIIRGEKIEEILKPIAIKRMLYGKPVPILAQGRVRENLKLSQGMRTDISPTLAKGYWYTKRTDILQMSAKSLKPIARGNKLGRGKVLPILATLNVREEQKESGGAVPQKSAKPPIDTRAELSKIAEVSHGTLDKVKFTIICLILFVVVS